MFKGGARILVRGTSDRISCPDLSSPVLQWRRQNFGSGGGHSSKMYSSKTFEKFIKNVHKNLKNSPKFFKN